MHSIDEFCLFFGAKLFCLFFTFFWSWIFFLFGLSFLSFFLSSLEEAFLLHSVLSVYILSLPFLLREEEIVSPFERRRARFVDRVCLRFVVGKAALLFLKTGEKKKEEFPREFH